LETERESQMTKADITEKIADNVAGLTKKEAAQLVDDFFELLRVTLEKGENIKVSGFGNFQVKQKQARRGRNPQTGEEIVIEGRRVLTFKPSTILKQKVNL